MTSLNEQDWLGKAIARRSIGSFVFVQHLYPRFSERGPHRHPWLHLSIVQRGYYDRRLGKRVSNYRSGDVALLTTDESHTDSYSLGTKCLHLVIPSDFETQLTRDFAGRGRAPIDPVHPINAAFSVALYREFKTSDGHSPFVIVSLLLDLVSRELGITTERSRLRPPWLRVLLEYLEETSDQSWSLINIAQEIRVHPVYLCRAFSEHFGMTLGRYVRELRILRGWQLVSLGHGGKIAEIANETGFSDESHFSRAFKRVYKTPPGRYRQNTERLIPFNSPCDSLWHPQQSLAMRKAFKCWM
jgi:AraC family transcriptional regulator